MFDEKAEKKKLRSDVLRMGLPMMFLLIIVSSLFWWQHLDTSQKLRGQTLITAKLRADQVNSGLAEAVSMLFFNVDAVISSLIALYIQDKNLKVFDDHAKTLLDKFPANSVMQIAVIGADGYMVYSNLHPDTRERVYLGDREHFQVHRHQSGAELYVGKPIMGRVSKQWTIQLSRAIKKNGKFQGVLVLSVSPHYLYATLAKIGQKFDDVMVILRQSGEVMARNLDFEHTIGALSRAGLPHDNAAPGESGSFRRFSILDQVERIYEWKRLENFPVVVVTGVNVNTLLQPIEEAIAKDFLKGVVSTIAMWTIALSAVAMMVWMQANVRRREWFEHQAQHDALTGLANRKALRIKMEQLMREAQSQPNGLALLFIDLDNFKPINDQYGHAVGDVLLKAIAGRIKGQARSDDLVVRLGGDEFVVLMQGAKNKDEALALADRIVQALRSPINVHHTRLSVGASIGVAMYPEQGATPDELLEAADKVMYEIKGEKKAYAS